MSMRSTPPSPEKEASTARLGLARIGSGCSKPVERVFPGCRSAACLLHEQAVPDRKLHQAIEFTGGTAPVSLLLLETDTKWGKCSLQMAELLDILTEEGADPNRVIFSHQDFTAEHTEYHDSLAKRGAYVEFDTFGCEAVAKIDEDVWFPSDGERINMVKRQIEMGNVERILISGGHILDPANNLDDQADLFIADGNKYGHNE